MTSVSISARQPFSRWPKLINAHPKAARNICGRTFANRSVDPLANHLGNVRARRVFGLIQHGSDDLVLAVPADHVGLAETAPQAGEQLGCEHRIDARTGGWLVL